MRTDDLFAAIVSAREISADGPHSIHGRKTAVMDLLLDMGVKFASNIPGIPHTFFGLDVHYEDAMPSSTVDIRHRDGRTLHRLVQVDGRWYAFNPSVLDFPMSR